MSPEKTAPTTLSSVTTLAGITLKRLARGKALWIAGLIAALPIGFTSIVRGGHRAPAMTDLFTLSISLLVLLPAMFVSASVGEELEDRTSTYLWSRPIARWAVLAGKLAALIPVVIALIVGGWCVEYAIWRGTLPPLASCGALAAACVACSLVAAGVATVVPKHGMALSIGYMLVDVFVGLLPFSLNALSITHQTSALALRSAGAGVATPLAITLAIAAVWGVVGFARIRRIEV